MNKKRILYQALLKAILLVGLVACTNLPTGEVHQTASATETEIFTETKAVTPTLSITPTPLSISDPLLLGDYARVSPEEMQADLDELFLQLENTHPYLYAKRSKAEVDHERQQIYNGFEQAITNVEFFRVVAPLVASLGDKHTAVSLPDKVMEQIAGSEVFFPLGVKFDDQRGFITENYSSNLDIVLGTELLEINGVTLADIQRLSTYQDLDADPFFLSLWFLYGSLPEYQVQVLRPGDASPQSFIVAALDVATIQQKAANAEKYVPGPPLSYKQISQEQIGLLTINNFEEIIPLLKSTFTQIQADEIEHLIIDIRANTGGKYEQVDLLMRYLTAHPYQQCSRRYFRLPDGNLPQEAECSLKEPSNTPSRFEGTIYLLIGPDTFSAAITFATILQDYDLAILIGEETHDTASYCAFVGEPQILSLNSFYLCSERCFVRPNGVLDENGVIPDIMVETTVLDELDDHDPVLAYTLDLIKSGTAP